MMKLNSNDSLYAEELQAAYNFINHHDDFLVVSHVQPDGDAASSTVAIGWLLSQLGKKFTMINEGAIPSRLDFLWSANEIHNYTLAPPNRTFSTVICVDCADFSRTGKVQQLFTEDRVLLNIDHHPTNDHFGTVNLIKADAAATAEILFDLMNQFGIVWDAQIATALYTGILTDTGGFRYANTTPRVMEIVSQLFTYGVNGHQLADHLLEKMSMAQMLLLTKALSRLTFTDGNRVGYIYVTPEDMSETGAVNEDLEGLVNYPRNIEGVDVGIMFKQVSDVAVKVSLRSNEHVNVAEIAQSFGGGGHVRAAGCRIEGNLNDVMNQVVERVRKQL